MKALTNILTHTLLMLLLLMLATCTEETAEVDNLSRQEQYVSVRMNIPGMTAATTRAEDGVIETIHALAFNADKELLATRTATDINNANNNNGFNGTFNIIVPNGTETIHFLANVGDYDFSSVKQESDLSNLSIGDWNMLRYWGKTTTSDGNTTLNVTLYRNLAKISIMPSITDTEFNQFTQDQLKMTGFYNANERGALVPCEDGEFNFDDNSEYCTMPQDLTSDNYQLYSFTTMTAFEHENTDANPTYIICRIGDYHYKVALADDEGNRYPIIRNHHYIIYVSDVDDYAHDDNYRADTYEKAFDKLPINLEVVEAMYVDFQYDNSQALQLGNTFTVTMTVPEGGTLTDFSITAEGFTFDQPASSYSTGTYTFTFTPTGVGSKTITFTGTGSENLNNVNTTIDVNVTASITANATTSTTLYYDSDEEQTVTVQVTVPAGVETLNIGGADFAKVTQNGEELTNNNGTFTYTVGEQKTIDFVFTLKSGIQNAGTSTISFNAENVTQKDIQITLAQCPTVTFTNTGTQTIQMGGNPLTVTMDVPVGKTLSNFSISVSPTNGLDVAQNGSSLTLTEGSYTTTNISNDQTFTFTPTSTGTYTITFDGAGTDVNMPAENSRTINLTVNAAAVTTMSVTPDNNIINMDNGDTNVTFTLTKPAGLQNVSVVVTDANGSKANRYFTIKANNNDLYYDQNNDNFNNITDYNNTENIPVIFTVKDNTIPTGNYTATFTGNYNGQNITVTATIEVVNTPKLQYSYGGTTLYMKDSNGDANPTSLDVKVTVPDGSTLSELSISASGFIIKQGGTVLSENGSYIYTKGTSTTFTFTPTSAGTKTISFSGTNESLIVNKEIPVTVVDGNAPKEIVIWEEEGGLEFNWPGDTSYNVEAIKNYIGGKLVIDITANSDSAQLQLYNVPSSNYLYYQDFETGENRLFEFTITESSSTEIKINGEKFTLNKIYIVPSS